MVIPLSVERGVGETTNHYDIAFEMPQMRLFIQLLSQSVLSPSLERVTNQLKLFTGLSWYRRVFAACVVKFLLSQ